MIVNILDGNSWLHDRYYDKNRGAWNYSEGHLCVLQYLHGRFCRNFNHAMWNNGASLYLRERRQTTLIPTPFVPIGGK